MRRKRSSILLNLAQTCVFSIQIEFDILISVRLHRKWSEMDCSLCRLTISRVQRWVSLAWNLEWMESCLRTPFSYQNCPVSPSNRLFLAFITWRILPWNHLRGQFVRITAGYAQSDDFACFVPNASGTHQIYWDISRE